MKKFCHCVFLFKDTTKETKKPLLSPLDLKDKKVIKGNRKLADDFQRVVRAKLLEKHPDIETRVTCIPPLIETNREAESRNRFQPENEAEGIIRVVKMFQTILHDNDEGTPAVILTRYKFDDFLKYVRGVETTHKKCDFDVLVLTKHGFITGEIKACKYDGTNLKRNIYKGQRQSSKCCMALKELFRDRPDITGVPVYKFIATPFVDRETLLQRDVASKESPRCKMGENLLTSNDLQSDDSFKKWFCKVFPKFRERHNMEDEQYLTIVERFIGFGSVFEEIPLEKVMKAEGNRHFCPRLTEKQQEIVEADDRFVAVAGDYGTGKSLTSVKRADRLVNNPTENVDVIMVTCNDISVSGELVDESLPRHMVNHLGSLLSSNSHQPDRNSERSIDPRIQFETFSSFIGESNCKQDSHSESILVKAVESELKKDRDTKLHLLLDEVPLNVLLNPCFTRFSEWLSEEAPERLSVWLTISTHSYRYWINSDDSTSWLKECVASFNPSFEFFYLEEVQRTPKLVYHLQKAISEYCGDSHATEFSRWAWEGSKPCLYRVPSCNCLRESCPRESRPLECSCAKERFVHTLGAIFKRLGLMDNSGKVKSKESWPGKVVIILSNVESGKLEKVLLNLVEDSCNQLGVRIRNELHREPDEASDQDRKEGEGDEILLTRDTYYVGCERHIVICVDPNAMKHWFNQSRIAYTSLVISRTLSAYIHLTFQDEEANQMFKMNMEAVMEGCSEKSNGKIHEALQQSKQNKCVQTLLDENVIEEILLEEILLEESQSHQNYY